VTSAFNSFTFALQAMAQYSNLYLIPGLGADKRMYAQQLKVFPNAIVLEHLRPVKNETITQYAVRMAKGIDTAKPFSLVGTSLGGIISMELSRMSAPEKIVLMASIKNRSEMPLFMRSMSTLNLHRLISGHRFKSFNNLLVKRLDSRGDSPAATIIRQMTNDTPAEFIDWAINAIVNWYPPDHYRSDILHIHGTNDQLFPIHKIKNPIIIPNGSHVMNMTMSYEVNKALLKALE
jgi:hypothetical protein